MGLSLPVKTAILSHSVPPAVSGSAVRIRRLFSEFDPDDYCIVTSRDIEPGQAADASARLPCAYHRLPSEWRRLKGPTAGPLRPVFDWLNVWLKTVQRARNLTRVLRAEGCRALIVFTGDLEDMPAAWLAARRVGGALIPVLDDDYIYQWRAGVKRGCARLIEPRVMRAAAGIFTISEFARDEYRRRYGTDSVVLYSPTPIPVGAPPDNVPMRHPPQVVKVLFSGSVYHVNFDAITMLLEGLRRLTDLEVRLQVHTPQTKEVLERRGITGPVDVLPSLGADRMAATQRAADILFLPLGFESGVPEVLRTSCPTKLSDYLISGRPILAYAPPDTFLSEYVRTTGCGVLVDRQDPVALAEAIRRLATDAALRQTLVANAFRCAAEKWDPARVQGVFLEAMSKWLGVKGP